MPRVLFTAPMDAERRNVVGRMASSAFDPVILGDLAADDRDEAWTKADVVVSMGFPREFPADFRTKARTVRLIQSLVAGGGQLPVDRGTAGGIVSCNPGA